MMKPPLAILDKITLKFCLVEPGYYEDGKFGVRIENLVLVVKAETKVRIGTVVTVTVSSHGQAATAQHQQLVGVEMYFEAKPLYSDIITSNFSF